MDFKSCQIAVDNIISAYTTSTHDADPRLCDGLQYVLTGGKRLRPIITVAILEKLLGPEWQSFREVCLVPEFIHCASLIIDDLPAFDNAKTRRGQPCVHIEKGEGLAYLLSFHMVTEAILIIHKQLAHLKQVYSEPQAYKKYETELYNIISNISGRKALQGQLRSTPNLCDRGLVPQNDIRKIIIQKTSSFFEIAIVTGWIVGGGDLDKLASLQRISNLMGLCYQIYDDFMDYQEDLDQPSHNYVHHRGIDSAHAEFIEYHNELGSAITEIGLDCPVFDHILNFLRVTVDAAKNDL